MDEDGLSFWNTFVRHLEVMWYCYRLSILNEILNQLDFDDLIKITFEVRW